MSYDISLKDVEGDIVEVPHFQEGGTYAIGGQSEAELNVTYNYAKHFDFRSLHKSTGKQSQQKLMAAKTLKVSP